METTLTPTESQSKIVYRISRVEDGRRIHRLVREGDGLELNSCYAYLLLCDHFSDTTVVAERDRALVGYVAAYRPPTEPETAFVWQVGVAPSARGRRVASTLLDELVEAPGCEGVRYLEATVTPDNTASRRLFESFAARRGAAFTWSSGYTAELFPAGHEDERLIRIGPFS